MCVAEVVQLDLMADGTAPISSRVLIHHVNVN
jgi:hypothetical protein